MCKRLLLVILTLLPLLCWGDVRVRVEAGPRRGRGGRRSERVYRGRYPYRPYYNRPRYRVRRYYVPGPVIVTPQVPAPQAMPANRVQVALVSEKPTIREGESFYVGLYFHIPDGTEIYWREEDEQLGPPVEWELPEGFEIEDISARAAVTEERDGQRVGYFRESIMLMAKINPPDDIDNGETVEIGADVRFFACEQGACQSVKFEPEIELRVIKP